MISHSKNVTRISENKETTVKRKEIRTYLWVWNNLHLKCISFHKPFDCLQVHPSIIAYIVSSLSKYNFCIDGKVDLQVVCIENFELLNRLELIDLFQTESVGQ
jgi:hypothetical protein